MVDALQLPRMSLRMQERLDEEKVIAKRVYAIDENVDAQYDDEGCGDECGLTTRL